MQFEKTDAVRNEDPYVTRHDLTSQRSLELDFLHANLAAVDDLLALMTDEDVMSRVGLEDRRKELQKLILDAENERKTRARDERHSR